MPPRDYGRSRRRKRETDGLSRWREWLDHQYDPGHYLGGNSPPELDHDTPNPLGWMLVFSGLALIVVFGLATIGGDVSIRQENLVESILQVLLLLFLIVIRLGSVLAGLRLVRGRRRGRRG